MLIKIKKKFLKKRKENKPLLRKEKNKRIILILLIFTILSGILVGVSFAKYQQTLQGQAFTKIAKPILEVEREPSLLLTALVPKASYIFEVKNYKEEQLNEVEMEYYIEIISPTDESIHFELYQQEKEIPLVKNETEKIKLSKDEKQTHHYCLEVTYDKTKSNSKKDINGNVEVKIHSVQKI